MLEQLKRWLLAAGAVIMGLLYMLLQIARSQRDTSRRDAEAAKQEAATAQARIAQRQAADRASSQAKAEGDKRVDEALARARAGDRSHFERGMRGD